MAICEDIKIKEVLDFTVLEQLADEGHDALEQYFGLSQEKWYCKILDKWR